MTPRRGYSLAATPPDVRCVEGASLDPSAVQLPAAMTDGTEPQPGYRSREFPDSFWRLVA
jgi:hypothetical protein